MLRFHRTVSMMRGTGTSRLVTAMLALLVMLAGSVALPAAEKLFDFGESPLNQAPKGFRSTISGEGKPGDWRVVMDEVPASAKPLTAVAPVSDRRYVLAQLSKDRTDEHFPLLIYDGDIYSDFTLTTRFKMVSGEAEQMAGLAFRIQDEKNYYYVRASAKGSTFRFFKMVDGGRPAPVGGEVQVPAGVWHEMSVECKGNQIHCLLNGKEIFPLLEDNTFRQGKIGLWTKSDSVSHFLDTRVTYVPRVTLAQKLVNELMTAYPRLLGIKVFTTDPGKTEVKMIASNDSGEIGALGGDAERGTLDKGSIYFKRGKTIFEVTLPLRDRNGDIVAAIRVLLEPFLGQTENNAVMRAVPIVKRMEQQVKAAKDLVE